MTLDDKRRVIEVLLCSGPPPQPSCSEAAELLGHGIDVGRFAVVNWLARFSDFDGNYAEIAAEAAYRLIESSPTLRQEWFGAP